MNFKKKLTLQLTPLFIVFTVILSTIFYSTTKNALGNVIKDTAKDSVDSQVLLMENFIETQPYSVNYLTYSQEVLELMKDPYNTAKQEIVNKLLDEYIIKSPLNLEGIFVHYFDEKGTLTMISNINRELVGYNEAVSDTFQRMKETKTYQLTPVMDTPGSEDKIVIFVHPIIDPSTGNVVAGLGTPILAADFMQYVKENQLADYKTLKTLVVDNEGTILHHDDNSLIGTITENSFILNVIEKIKNGREIETTNTIRFQDGKKVLTTYSVVPKTNWLLVTTIETKEVNAPITKILGVDILVSIVVIIISFLFILVVSGYISKPIKALTILLNRIANLDLSDTTTNQSLLKRHDELQSMAKAVYKTREQLRTMTLDIKDTAVTTLKNTVELSDAIGITERSIAEIDNAASEMTTNAVTLAESSDTGIEMLNDLQTSIRKSNEISNETKVSVQVTIEAQKNGMECMQALDNSIQKNNEINQLVEEKIKKLDEKSELISSFTDMIKQITQQINLLSLNASIESARAGEAGKGFSVVAGEIKNLATQTEASAKEIETVTKEFKEELNHIKAQMLQSTESLDDTFTKSLETKEAFTKIEGAVSEIVVQVNELTNRIEHIHTNANVVNDSMGNVSSVATLNAASTQQISASIEEQGNNISSMHTSSQKLEGIVNTLNRLVDQYKL